MGKLCGLNFTDGLRYNHINGSVLRIFFIVAEVTPNVIVWVQIQGMCLNCILLTTHSPASGRRQTTRKSSRYYSAPINWTGVNLLWLFSYRVKDPRGVCLGGDCPESRFSRSFRYILIWGCGASSSFVLQHLPLGIHNRFLCATDGIPEPVCPCKWKRNRSCYTNTTANLPCRY